MTFPAVTANISNCYQVGLVVANQNINIRVAYPDAGYVVSPRVIVRAGGRAFDRRTHAVPVVLTDEYHRKVPQLGDVVRLEYLSLIGCSVSIESNADVVFSLVFHGQGDTCSEWHL